MIDDNCNYTDINSSDVEEINTGKMYVDVESVDSVETLIEITGMYIPLCMYGYNLYLYVYLCLYVHAYMNVVMYVLMRVCMYRLVCIYACMYACIYIYMYVCIHVYGM